MMYLVNINNQTSAHPDGASAMDAIDAAVNNLFESADKEPNITNTLLISLQRGVQTSVEEAVRKGYNS